MRIAQVAPLSESVPPMQYGGTERVVSYLTEALVQRGHDVTLFASGDSQTSARLVSPVPIALWRGEHEMPDAFHSIQLELLRREARQFDIIHFHGEHSHLPLMQEMDVPFVTTHHGRLDLSDLVPLFQTFPDAPLVSISDSQRAPHPDLNWVATVHHGLPVDLLRPREERGEYLAFMGRTSPEKGLNNAIAIARRVGMTLKISAAVQPFNRDYFEREIRPQLDHPLIEFVGELGGREKEEFLRHAHALLFPIEWPEPFGLVQIEAMACGTPVVAFRRGSVPEVVRHGVSGWIVDDLDQAVAAVQEVDRLSREAVRADFDERFTVDRMVDDYLGVYERVIEAHWSTRAPSTRDESPWMLDGNGTLQVGAET